MLPVLQLLFALFAIYSALKFPEQLRLLIPLVCLLLMLLINRMDRAKAEQKKERNSFLKEEIDKVMKKDLTTIKDQDFFTIESLLWPKNELFLTDAVHSVFKDLGFKISTGVHYYSVDRIVKIPNTDKAFGVEILMSENEVEANHPKLRRALEFEKEKKEREKTLIIVSTHIHLPISERGQARDVSEELVNFLIRHNMSFITAYHLYEFWQKTKGGKKGVFGIFQKLYSHTGGIFALNESDFFSSKTAGELPIQ